MPESMPDIALIDSHCHLDLPHFAGDREAVLGRAQEAGVVAMITQGVDLASSRAAIALAEQHPSIFAAVGIHPTECADFQPAMLAEVRVLAGHAKVVAIGEIGLDDYWQDVPLPQQQKVLRLQLDLAAELGLPVVLHDREAHELIMAELETWIHDRLPGSPLAQRPFVGVLHSFSGDAAMARQAYDLGFVLGLGGPVTFKNARDLQALACELDPQRLILETDAPYLSPHPYRGKRNEPARVRLVAEKLAALWHTSLTDVATTTTRTARRLFALPPTILP